MLNDMKKIIIYLLLENNNACRKKKLQDGMCTHLVHIVVQKTFIS